jgi:translation initiation factor 6
MLIRLDVNGNPNLGTLAVANSSSCVVSPNFSDSRVDEISEALNAEVIPSTIGGMTVIGALCIANDHGMVVSNIIESEERARLGATFDVMVLDDRLNAVGNNVLLGSRSAIANPKYPKRVLKTIADHLDVEIVPGTLGGLKTVGSAAVLNSKGILCHPKTDGKEVANLEEVFGLEIEFGTANFGSPMLGSAIVANDNGAATGTPTTGVELNRIESALDLIK